LSSQSPVEVLGDAGNATITGPPVFLMVSSFSITSCSLYVLEQMRISSFAVLPVMAAWIVLYPGLAQLVPGGGTVGADLFTHTVAADATAGTAATPADTAMAKMASFRAALALPP
jgi:hypothetical protein